PPTGVARAGSPGPAPTGSGGGRTRPCRSSAELTAPGACDRVVTSMAEPRVIFVLSDATGETAEKVVRAALLQFTNVPVQLRMYTRVRLEAEMRSIIGRAKQMHALVVFTVVSNAHRELLRRLCDEENVDAVDLIGTLMAKLASHLAPHPKRGPARFHPLNAESC